MDCRKVRAAHHAEAEDVGFGGAALHHDLLGCQPVEGAHSTFHLCAGPRAVLRNTHIRNLGLQL